ncbi:MAG TPA: nuclear transport factor 2 family protein [Allosphingosinicella sp.]|nr:nuclear transport factor 2 family protein [Allosphingosinicella sp.]
MLALLFASAIAGEDVAEIRRLRAQSNAAIAAHRPTEVRRLLADDYTALPGSSGRPLDADQTERRLAAAFADPTFVTYVRTPGWVGVASSGKRAAETGAWYGLWRKPDGNMRLSGVYQATWVPSAGSWRLLNESFVTLRCGGSKACGEVD